MRLIGGVIIRAVYSADLYSIVLRGPEGRSTNDDLMLRLAGVRGRTITRPIDPPPHALRLFDPDADSDVSPMEPGPCPIARDAAERLLAKADVRASIPVSGPGWLEHLRPGALVDGSLWFLRHGEPVSVAEELVRMGHATRIDGTTANQQAA
ncbi:MAG: hypothetical protein KDB00_10870 [Planctomycetales bacterium]|nr:hypothetical protein [Planctomycetales bacterium]